MNGATAGKGSEGSQNGNSALYAGGPSYHAGTTIPHNQTPSVRQIRRVMLRHQGDSRSAFAGSDCCSCYAQTTSSSFRTTFLIPKPDGAHLAAKLLTAKDFTCL